MYFGSTTVVFNVWIFPKYKCYTTIIFYSKVSHVDAVVCWTVFRSCDKFSYTPLTDHTLFQYKYTSTIPIQPPTLVNLPGAAVEAETVLAQRTVMSFTCTDTVDAPAARITVSPSTTPEFFRLQTTSSVARSSGNKVVQSCVLAKKTLSVVVRMRSLPKIRSFSRRY